MNNELPRIERDPQLPGEYAATLRTQADTNPTTGEIVGYSQTLTFSSDPLDSLLTLEKGSGGVLEYSLTQGVTPELESYIRRSSEPQSPRTDIQNAQVM